MVGLLGVCILRDRHHTSNRATAFDIILPINSFNPPDPLGLLTNGRCCETLNATLELEAEMAESSAPREMTDDEFAELASQLFDLARHGDAPALQRLLDKGLPPNVRNQNGDTLLMLASYHGHIDAVKTLLAAGADANMPNDKNQLPLAGAAFKGDLGVAKVLVSKGAEVNGCAADGRTALMMAAMFNRTDFVTFLLEQGADPQARDAAGMNALGAAHAMGAQDTATLLANL